MKFYFFLISLFFFSCETEPKTHVIISGVVSSDVSDSLLLKTDNRYRFYRQPEISRSIGLNEDGTFSDTIELSEGNYELQAEGTTTKLFLKPGYALHIDLTEDVIVISGKGQKENEYIQERVSLTEKIRSYNYWQYFSTLPEEKFLKYADSLEALHLDLLSKHEQLDERLQKAEANWARVQKAHKFINYSFTREMNAPNYDPSENYPDPLAGLEVNDEDILDVSFFPMVMLLYNGPRADEKEIDQWQYILSEGYPVSNPEVKEEVLYRTAKYTMADFQELDDFYVEAKPVIRDKLKWTEITEKYNELQQLKNGKPAPGFQLQNMKGEAISLEELKGNIVYLDFWASWCRPCIDEIPYFKKLQDEFEQENVKFVSIGIDSKKENLQKLIDMHQLGGIHLFETDKEDMLKRKYAIEGIPRYVLIDREGNIVEKDAARPSNPLLAEQIKSLLQI